MCEEGGREARSHILEEARLNGIYNQIVGSNVSELFFLPLQAWFFLLCGLISHCSNVGNHRVRKYNVVRNDAKEPLCLGHRALASSQKAGLTYTYTGILKEQT